MSMIDVREYAPAAMTALERVTAAIPRAGRRDVLADIAFAEVALKRGMRALLLLHEIREGADTEIPIPERDARIRAILEAD